MKIALQVGTAGWASSWVPFYEKSGAWKLGGVVSRSQEALDAFHLKHGRAMQSYTNYAEALKGDYDAVIISAPHQVHVPLAIQALRAGKRVLVEKPLSDSYTAALELAKVARETSGMVMVSQNFRYREPLWQLRATCRDLGPISAMRVEMIQEYADYLNKVAKNNRVSCLLEEVFIHQADQARFIVGANPTQVFTSAWADRWDESGQANNADVLVEFSNGTRFNYHGSWSTRGFKTTWAGSWRVRAEHGTIDWDGSEQGGVTLHPRKDASISLQAPVGFPGFDRIGILRELAAAIDERRPPACSLEDNLWSFRIVTAAVMSHEQRRPIEIAELLK
ncbi:Gfo/Idh/MocA family oxidoreductase [Oleiharenicola lentus]|uniref:Gfo/Idh/MocA family oxidoreductase n=1 Tax=Oleiharenicola lentus TaxID=2508720 RepID=A0A4Q1CA29_9BACT|nr:Gfo/Idh/MocA family oxidoreductase [Oleiharenicola lentus]RXK55913.1 Gfo/Idh/MocA family oxidoreductase [Oleiharenicola lentus]